MPTEEVIGIERVLENEKGQSWNNKKLRWSIVHNVNNESKPYDIELEMVLISSKRILKVNQEVKDVRMCSFGYEVEFEIGEKLKGFIKQDSLTFELFINNKSFTSLQQSNREAMYQPPTLDVENINPWINKKLGDENPFFSPKVSNKEQKKQEKPLISSPPPTKVTIVKMKSMEEEEKLPSPPVPKLKIKQFSLIETKQEKKQTENSIKDTQSELMRILMEEKKKKKKQEEEHQIF